MPWPVLLVFPVVGALIGWLTNWLAVKMIFHPRSMHTFLGIRVQGLLPRRRSELAESVAQTVERDLISVEQIQEAVVDLVNSERVRSMLHERVDHLMDEQLDKLGPMIRAFVSSDFRDRIKTRLEVEVLDFVGRLSGELHEDLERHMDIQEMVRSRIESFDMDRLESIVLRIAQKELRGIEILGGVLGFLVGCAQVGLVLIV